MPICPTSQMEFAGPILDRFDPEHGIRRRRVQVDNVSHSLIEKVYGGERSALRTVSSGNAERWLDCGFWSTSHGQGLTFAPTSNQEPELWMQFEIMWTKGADNSHTGNIIQGRDIWLICNEGPSARRLFGISVHGSASVSNSIGTVGVMLFPGNNKSTTDTEVPWTNGVMKTLTLHYKQSTGANDGVYRVWDGDTLIADLTHNQTQDIVNFRVGCYNQSTALGGGSIAYSYCTRAGFAEPTPFQEELGGDINELMIDRAKFGICWGDVGPTSAAISYAEDPGVYRHDWRNVDDLQMQVEYHPVGTDAMTTGLSTEWMPLLKSRDYMGSQRVTGLQPGTEYNYNVNIRRSSDPGTVEAGPQRQFKTLPTSGVLRMSSTHCHDGSFAYPSRNWMRYLTAGVDWVHFQGDVCYAGSSNNTDLSQPLRHSTDTVTGHAEFLRDALDDVFMLRYLHKRHASLMWDDHDSMPNNWWAEWRKGYEAGPNGFVDLTEYLHPDDQLEWGTGWFAKSGPIDGSDADASYLTGTKGEIYETMRQMAWHSWGQSAIGCDINEDETKWEMYRYQDVAGIRFITLDTRSCNDWSPRSEPTSPVNANSAMLGARQLAWLKWLIDTAEEDGVQRIIIFSNTVFSDVHTISDEWNRVSLAERNEVAAYITEKLADTGIGVGWVVGDRHAQWITRRFGTGYAENESQFVADHRGEILFEVNFGQSKKDDLGSNYSVVWETAEDMVFSSKAGLAGDIQRFAEFWGYMDINVTNGELDIQCYATEAGSLEGELQLPGRVAPAGEGSRLIHVIAPWLEEEEA